MRIRECESINTRPLTLCLPACPPILPLSRLYFPNQYCLPPLCVCIKMCLSFDFFSIDIVQCQACAWEKDPLQVTFNERMEVSVCLMSRSNHFQIQSCILFLRCTVYILQHRNTGCNFHFFVTVFCFVTCLTCMCISLTDLMEIREDMGELFAILY